MGKTEQFDGDVFLTPSQVAARFAVSPKTVARWGVNGLLSTVRTVGGHRRYYAKEVEAAVADRTQLKRRHRSRRS